MIAVEAVKILVMSAVKSVWDCAVRLASAPAVRVTLRSAATPSEISTTPRYIAIISGARNANSTAETPRLSRAKRDRSRGIHSVIVFMAKRLMTRICGSCCRERLVTKDCRCNKQALVIAQIGEIDAERREIDRPLIV